MPHATGIALFTDLDGTLLDRPHEERSVELFAESIMRAGKAFLDNPFDSPFIPDWLRVSAADPDFIDDMLAALEADKALL